MTERIGLEVNVVRDGDAAVLAVGGELDMRTSSLLSEAVAARLASGASELTLDLRELAFMDSSGVRLLIELTDRAREEGWRLMLLAPRQQPTALVLKVTGADTALPFQEGPEP